MHIHSIFFALIKESNANDDVLGLPYLPNEKSCIPMLSLEIKWLEFRQKKQITGLQQTDVTFPLELYYFNQKLAFFEPVVERVMLKGHIVNDVSGNSEMKLLIEDVLNLNLSVALYENIFVLMENLKSERDTYKRYLIEHSERESLYA